MQALALICASQSEYHASTFTTVLCVLNSEQGMLYLVAAKRNLPNILYGVLHHQHLWMRWQQCPRTEAGTPVSLLTLQALH